MSTVRAVERALLVRMAPGAARAPALAQLVLQGPTVHPDGAPVQPVLPGGMALEVVPVTNVRVLVPQAFIVLLGLATLQRILAPLAPTLKLANPPLSASPALQAAMEVRAT